MNTVKKKSLVRMLVEAGLMPEDAEEIADLAEDREEPLSAAEVAQSARVNDEAIERARVWWMFFDAVPPEFKRLLEAELEA